MYVTPLSLFKDFLFFSTPVSSQTHTTMLFKFELIIHPFQSELNKLSPLSGFEPGTSPVAIIEVHLFICYYLNIKLWMVVVYFDKSWPKYNFELSHQNFLFFAFCVFIQEIESLWHIGMSSGSGTGSGTGLICRDPRSIFKFNLTIVFLSKNSRSTLSQN